MRRLIIQSVETARRIVVAVVGTTVLLIGIALLVLPGPAMVVIPIGLAILGFEFAWARHWLHRLREGADAVWRNGSQLLNGALRRKPAGAEKEPERP